MTDPCDRCEDPEASSFDESGELGYGPIPLCRPCREWTLDEIAEEAAYATSSTT